MPADAPTVPAPGPSRAERLTSLRERLRAAEAALGDASEWLTGPTRDLALEGVLRVRATREAIDRWTAPTAVYVSEEDLCAANGPLVRGRV